MEIIKRFGYRIARINKSNTGVITLKRDLVEPLEKAIIELTEYQLKDNHVVYVIRDENYNTFAIYFHDSEAILGQESDIIIKTKE